MKAKYLGLDLSSPVVVSSSPYTATVSNIEQCVRNGAGAVVLKSIFEEQIIRHAAALDYASQQGMGDSGEYLERYIGDAYKGEFLKLVADARTTGVPVIASINCIASAEAWTDYAVSMEQAGAAALELNIFLQPTDRHRSAQELEQEYADVVRRVAEAVKIPVSVKLPMRLTNVLAVADSLLARGARGVVMFNRFFEPDIDVERMTFVNGDPFSEPAELRNVLRRVALQRSVGVAQRIAYDGYLRRCAAAYGFRRFDGRARRRSGREGAVVRRERRADLLGDPREGLRRDRGHQPLHRPVGRTPRLRVAGRVPREDELRQCRKRRLPARSIHEIFPARRRIAARGTDLRRCVPETVAVSGTSLFGPFPPPGHAERIFSFVRQKHLLRVTYSEPDMCS